MSLFSWKSEYSVNDAILDSHHQQLFTLLNSIYENVMSSQQLDCVLPKFEELSEYTNHHFNEEEQYMRKRNFPEINDHIAMPREFTKTINELRESYHDNDLEVARELIVVLGEWLLHHVLKEDRKYSLLSNDIKYQAQNMSPP